MSYRDHLEAQQKYIRTKKEAREARREREQRPRPPRIDPPPPGINPWLIILSVFLFIVPLIAFVLALPSALAPTKAISGDLKVWIYSSEEEYIDLRNWLEPELKANELKWTIAHAVDKYDMFALLRAGDGDLLIIEKDLAHELYAADSLAPLMDKNDGNTWGNCFAPLWQVQPFRKTYGWAIPVTGNIDDARHLFTVMRQFGPTFSSWKRIQQ